MKNFAFCPSFLLGFIALTAFFCWENLARAQYDAISIPIKADQPVEFYSLSLEENSHPLATLPKKVFKKISAQKGETLEIKSIILSQNVLAIMDGLTRGTDAPQIGEIESQIDSQDSHALLEILTRMAEERRHGETDQEWEEIATRFRGNRTRALFNAYLLSTGYLEVTPDSLKKFTHEDGVRYFVPIRQILKGAGNINVKAAQLSVLQSLTLTLLKDLQGSNSTPAIDSIASNFEAVCYSTECDVLGKGSLGLLIADFHRTYLTGKRDPLSDEDTARLQLRKQLCLFKLIHDSFPAIPGLQSIDDLVRAENLDCSNREGLLAGLTEISDD